MNTVVPYKIVVPSSQRSGLMGELLKLLPTATICVEESEEEAYRRFVPARQLWLHPPMANMAQKRNWIIDNVGVPAHAQIDDDLVCVWSLVHSSRRRITHPDAILRLIENGVNILADLGLTCYCWGRVASSKRYSNCEPIGLASLMSSAFVLHRPGIRFDERLDLGEDLDFTLQTLVQDRILIRDERFVFDHSVVVKASGGAHQVHTADSVSQWKSALRAKWGDHVKFVGKLTSQLPPGARVALTSRIRVRRRARTDYA